MKIQVEMFIGRGYPGWYAVLKDNYGVWGSGPTREEAKAQFVERYNEKSRDQKTVEDFEFVQL
jgi:hypothetical protein